MCVYACVCACVYVCVIFVSFLLLSYPLPPPSRCQHLSYYSDKKARDVNLTCRCHLSSIVLGSVCLPVFVCDIMYACHLIAGVSLFTLHIIRTASFSLLSIFLSFICLVLGHTMFTICLK